MLIEAVHTVQAKEIPQKTDGDVEKGSEVSFSDILEKLFSGKGKKTANSKKKVPLAQGEASGAKTAFEGLKKGESARKLAVETGSAADAPRVSEFPRTLGSNAEKSALLSNDARTPGETPAQREGETVGESSSDTRKAKVPSSMRGAIGSQTAAAIGEPESRGPYVPRSTEPERKTETSIRPKAMDAGKSPVITVTDLRKSLTAGRPKAEKLESAADIVREAKTRPGEEGGQPSRTTDLTVRVAEQPRTAPGQTVPPSFREALLSELRNGTNAEIVRSGGIVLKDGDEGEIRLILKPENLGNVRIRLSLHDNQVSGRIIVDSRAVREVFEQNLDALQHAFKESGFDATGLHVTVGGREQGKREEFVEVPVGMKRIETIDETASFVDNREWGTVNLIA